MKLTFTKLFGTAALLSLMVTAVSAQSQEKTLASVQTMKKKDAKADSVVAATVKPVETSTTAAPAVKADDAAWTPVRRLWGYAFGDLYYAAHADAVSNNRGPETMYNGVPQNRNAFQFRRIYLGYDYDINQKFTAEVLLASEPNANTGTLSGTTASSGDNLADNKMGFFIKNFNLRYRNLWEGTDLVVGEMSTPGFALNEPGTNGATSLSEATWGYRFIEKTVTDFHKNNSYDVGAALQGTFDPKTKNFGYVVMVSNNTQSNLLSASNANTGFYKIFYGDLWGKFLDKKLSVDFYAHYAQTAPTTALPDQSNNMIKLFAAYSTKPISVGVEAYTQQFTNGVTNTTTKVTSNATAQAISIWAKGAINDKMGWFARYDTYNPYTDYDATANYTINTNYGSYNAIGASTKEQFYTAGLDFIPAPKIHFSPNVWIIQYNDQRAATTSGYIANDHTVVFRATFYYTFGK